MFSRTVIITIIIFNLNIYANSAQSDILEKAFSVTDVFTAHIGCYVYRYIQR